MMNTSLTYDDLAEAAALMADRLLAAQNENGAKWRAIPAELGPWSRAAQTFSRWAHLGVWERLLGLAQERGVQLGMTFLDGTSIRAHHKAAGAEKRGPPARRAMRVRRWAARGADTEPRRA